MGFNVSGTLDLDGRGWEKTLHKAQSDTEKFAQKASGSLESAFSGSLGTGLGLLTKGLEVLGLGAVAALGKRMSDALMDEFKEIKIGSQITNLDPETFQRMRNTVEPLGGSMEGVAKSMEHVAIAMEKIKEGGPEGEKMFKNMQRLEVSLADIKSGDYQRVWFAIANGMKGAELTGEKLAALHEVEGRGALELIPAYKKGFGNPAAAAGILNDRELSRIAKLKEGSAELNGIWKDIGHSAGKFFSMIWQGSSNVIPKAIKILSGGIGGDDRSLKDLGNVIMLRQKDAARKEAQTEEESNKWQAEQDGKLRAAEKKKVEEAIPKLQDEIMKENRAAALAGMSKAQKIKFFSGEVAENDRKQKEFEDLYKQSAAFGNPHPEMQKRALEYTLAASTAKKELAELQRQPEGQPHEQRAFDSLARIGGFAFSGSGNPERHLSEIERHTGEIANATRRKGGRFP